MDTIGKKIRDLEQLKKELEELDLAAEVLTPGTLAVECWWIWMIQEKVLPDI